MATVMTNKVNIRELSVIAVIVTFNPLVSNLSYLVSHLQSQKCRIIIVDNGSNNVKDIFKLVKDYGNTEILPLAENVGIAAAQNIGIRHGLNHGGDFTLLFDQDSNISNDYVELMLKDFLSLKRISRIAALGPTLQDSRYNKIYPVIRLSNHGFRTKITPNTSSTQPVEVTCIIASGSLIDNAIFNASTLMDEALFIDYVDTEWCLRIINLGFKIFVTPNVIMQHAIGDAHIQIFTFVVPVHSVWRRYYRVRNGVLMLKMAHVPKLLAMREIMFSLVHQLILLIKTKEIGYLKIYFRAMLDAIRKSI
ncbi:glycosyltransferase family 2 protein [Kosakonia sp. YIM B13611]|uniref:glycosyltransferase family 2 protein n=2 Tax=Kosakonia TaxID=1330547 RepID=UPI003699A62B